MSNLQVGAAQVDITPTAGTHLSGSGAGVHRGAESILDPLYARAVVFEKDGQLICLLALDVTIITREWTDRIKGQAAQRWGLDPEAILVHATQTHSAPSLGYFMFDDDFPRLAGEQEYLRGAEKGLRGASGYADFGGDRARDRLASAGPDRRRQRGARRPGL